MFGAHAEQVGVWQDEANKRLVVSFRGTEEDRWGDVLTDVNFLLVSEAKTETETGTESEPDTAIELNFSV